MPVKTIIRLSSAPEGFGQTPDELASEGFTSTLPIQHTHIYFEDEAQGLYIGLWDTTAMVEAGGPYACDEFMWLLEGEAAIKNNKTGLVEKAKAGEAFVIPKGYDCQWHQQGYLRKFFVISEHPDEAIPEQPTVEGIVIPEADFRLQPQMKNRPFLLPQNAPIPQQNVCYRNAGDKFRAGAWQSEPFESAQQAFPYNEFGYVEQGSLTLIDQLGEAQIFDAGDAFFIPQGVECSARASDRVRLFFAEIHSA
ncbi:MAG: cupin domain-containing protein [Motiliproteus sp.]